MCHRVMYPHEKSIKTNKQFSRQLLTLKCKLDTGLPFEIFMKASLIKVLPKVLIKYFMKLCCGSGVDKFVAWQCNNLT